MRGRSSRRHSWLWIAVVACTAAGIGAACRRPAPTWVALDLAIAGPASLVAGEVAQIDIGTADGRAFLGSGWYYDERNRTTGETFAWSRGRSSEVLFHLGWRRDIVMVARCRGFQFPGAPDQTVSFELNGHALGGAMSLEPSPDELRIVLPAAAQIVGRNRLVVHYGRVDAPADVTSGSTDERELAVAWSEIVFDGVDGGPVQRAGQECIMPAGARVDAFLDLLPDSMLTIETCESIGGASTDLEVSILGESSLEPEVVLWKCSGEPIAHRLGARAGLTRIRLTTRPASDVAAPAGVRLLRPRIVSPQPVQAPEQDQPGAETETVESPPNVIIYLVDALRSDRLGVYGCDRPLSPRLDTLAATGIVFTDVVAQSSWTKAAVASIFTGLGPRAHGVNGPDDRLPDALATLPELLHGAGYRTAAVVANAYVGRPFGFARGFDHFEFIEHTQGRSDVLHERVAAWLEAHDPGDGPFFLYVHTIDPHAPYAPPSPFLETFAADVKDPSVGQVETVRGLVLGTVAPTAELGRDLRELYDGEVAANDASFGSLLDELEAMGELDNTVIIFTSDHGEAFGEHGNWTHGLDLTNEVLSIPLVVRLPGGAGGGQRVSTPVQHIDLLPTILSLCAVDPPSRAPGARLLDLTGTIRVGEDRTIFSYLDYWGRTGASAQADGWKLIAPMSPEFGSTMELYDHDNDRLEVHDLASDAPVRAGWLETRLNDALKTEGVSLPTEVDAETRAQLEAIGYLQ